MRSQEDTRTYAFLHALSELGDLKHTHLHPGHVDSVDVLMRELAELGARRSHASTLAAQGVVAAVCVKQTTLSTVNTTLSTVNTTLSVQSTQLSVQST